MTALKRLMMIGLILGGLAACGQPIEPEAARTILDEAWQAPRHVVWELEWPAAPLGGPLTVESWRAGDRYRFEILEATAPALVGQTLVSDGSTVWRYNRLAVKPAPIPAKPRLSPVTDALATIDRLLAAAPVRATRRRAAPLNHGPAWEIELILENEDHLTMWVDGETGLPVRIIFSVGGKRATLQARRLERLVQPAEGLFAPP